MGRKLAMGLALITAAAMLLASCVPGKQAMKTIVYNAEIPPIDTVLPAVTETATFSLG